MVHTGVTAAWLAFAFIFWIIALAGIAAAQNKCQGQTTVKTLTGATTKAFATSAVLPSLGYTISYKTGYWV